MAIYCIQCGAGLPDDAVFCLKCGKQLKGGSASPSTSSSSETELYQCEINNLHLTNEYGYDIEQGGGTCTVTTRRLIFRTRKAGLIQIFLRDLEGVHADRPNLIFTKYNVITFKGFGFAWCKENEKLASVIEKAMLQAK